MPGSLTTPGRTGARAGAPVHLAFRSGYGVGARDDFPFAAQWLACAIPCRRFAAGLATGDALKWTPVLGPAVKVLSVLLCFQRSERHDEVTQEV